jgi:methyltransferase
MDHPNYLIVVLEVALLPMVFGLWPIALVFSALNAVILAIRIKAEDEALASLRG